MIEKIFISSGRGEEQLELLSAEIVAGKGIVGDRNFGMARWPGQNITFIESEEIEGFNKKFNRNINLSDTRRNIITKGVRVNELVGKVFTIGKCSFRGVELCEPCSILGELLANESMVKHEVVRAFVGKGGLRADVLSSGKISVNMGIFELKSQV